MEFERKLFNWFVIPGIITEILVIVLGLNLSLLSNPIGGPGGLVAGLAMLKFELMFLAYLLIAGIYSILLPYKYYKKKDAFLVCVRRFLKFSVTYLTIFDAMILHQWYACYMWNLIRSINTLILIPLTVFIFIVTGYFIFWMRKVNQHQGVKYFSKSLIKTLCIVLGVLLLLCLIFLSPVLF